MGGVFDHLHMKRNTAGSSNELSFDVLDAASSDLAGKDKKAVVGSSLPKVAQGSFHSVSGPSALSGQPEVERRKTERRKVRFRNLLIGLAVIAAVAAIVSSAVVSYGPRDAQEEEYFDSGLDAFVSELVELDGFMAKVDDVMDDPLSDESAQSYEAILGKADSVQVQISSIRKRIGDASDSLVSADRRAKFDQLDSAAEARSSMLTAAQGAISLAAEVDGEAANANRAWSAVLDADQLARQATRQANEATTEAETEEALALTRQALDELSAALSELQSIADRHQGIDLGNQLAYLKVKVEAIGHAVATGDALLDMDRTRAKAENDAYNEADERAAALATELPPSVEDAVRDAYEREIQVYMAKYQSSREQAIAADAEVRSYLEG